MNQNDAQLMLFEPEAPGLSQGSILAHCDYQEARKLARTSDPETSHQAAEKLERTGELRGQRRRVWLALLKSPGLTSAELAAKHNLGRHLVARRLPDLQRAGWAVKGMSRKCRATDNRAVIWWAIAKGLNEADSESATKSDG